MLRKAGTRWYRGLNRWETSAVNAWGVALIAVCGRTLVWPHTHSVYPIFIGAARRWRAGVSLYAPVSGLDQFRYSPVVAALLTPLSLLPDRLGGVLWRLLNAGVLLGAVAWWTRAGLPRTLSASERAVLFLLLLPLSLGNLNNGQANPLMLGLLLGAIVAAAEESWTLASVGVALASFLKIYPVVVGLLLVLLYPRRFAGRFVAALACGATLPFLFQQPGYVVAQYEEWIRHLLSEPRYGWMEVWYSDARLLWRAWLVPLGFRSYLVMQIVTAAGIAVLCLAAQRARWPPRRLLTLMLGLTCCWMTVFGLSTESATYILLAPVLAWALLEAWLERLPLALRATLVCSYMLLVSTQVAGWFPGMVSRVRELGTQPLAALLLLGCLLFETLRRLRSGDVSC